MSGLGLAKRSARRREHEAGKNSDNRDHDKQLKERKALNFSGGVFSM